MFAKIWSNYRPWIWGNRFRGCLGWLCTLARGNVWATCTKGTGHKGNTFLPFPEVFVTFVAAHVKVVSWTATSNAKGKAKPRKFIFTVSSQRGTTVQAYFDCFALWSLHYVMFFLALKIFVIFLWNTLHNVFRHSYHRGIRGILMDLMVHFVLILFLTFDVVIV